jgi:hypothetical protein
MNLDPSVLGDLVAAGVLTEAQAESARIRQDERGGPIDLAIVETAGDGDAGLDEQRLAERLAAAHGLATADPARLARPSSRALRAVPTVLAAQLGVLPLRLDDGALQVAVSTEAPDPTALEFELGYRIEPVLALTHRLREAMARNLGIPPPARIQRILSGPGASLPGRSGAFSPPTTGRDWVDRALSQLSASRHDPSAWGAVLGRQGAASLMMRLYLVRRLDRLACVAGGGRGVRAAQIKALELDIPAEGPLAEALEGAAFHGAAPDDAALGTLAARLGRDTLGDLLILPVRDREEAVVGVFVGTHGGRTIPGPVGDAFERLIAGLARQWPFQAVANPRATTELPVSEALTAAARLSAAPAPSANAETAGLDPLANDVRSAASDLDGALDDSLDGEDTPDPFATDESLGPRDDIEPSPHAVDPRARPAETPPPSSGRRTLGYVFPAIDEHPSADSGDEPDPEPLEPDDPGSGADPTGPAQIDTLEALEDGAEIAPRARLTAAFPAFDPLTGKPTIPLEDDQPIDVSVGPDPTASEENVHGTPARPPVDDEVGPDPSSGSGEVDDDSMDVGADPIASPEESILGTIMGMPSIGPGGLSSDTSDDDDDVSPDIDELGTINPDAVVEGANSIRPTLRMENLPDALAEFIEGAAASPAPRTSTSAGAATPLPDQPAEGPARVMTLSDAVSALDPPGAATPATPRRVGEMPAPKLLDMDHMSTQPAGRAILLPRVPDPDLPDAPSEGPEKRETGEYPPRVTAVRTVKIAPPTVQDMPVFRFRALEDAGGDGPDPSPPALPEVSPIGDVDPFGGSQPEPPAHSEAHPPVGREPTPTPLPDPGGTHVDALSAPTEVDPRLRDAVRALAGDNPSARVVAENRVMDAGPLGIAALVEQFPGHLVVDRYVVEPGEVPIVQHSELLRVLARFGSTVSPRLVQLYGHISPEVRYYAVSMFTEVDDDAQLGAIAGALADHDPTVRGAARYVFDTHAGAAARTRAVEVMTAAAGGQTLARRRAAAEALGALRAIEGAPALVSLLDAEVPQLAEAAHHALVEITWHDFGLQGWQWTYWIERNSDRPRPEWLMEALLSDQPSLRKGALRDLVQIARNDFGYRLDAPQNLRQDAVARFRRWWASGGRARYLANRR